MQASRTLASLVWVLLTSTAIAQDAPPPPAPESAPEQPKGLVKNESGAFDGFTLYAPLQSGTTFLLDMRGEIAHRWDHGLGSTGNYLLDNGHLLFISRIEDNPVFFGGGIGGRIRELDWDGKLVWEFVLSTEQRMTHHDVEPMPNGHILAIAWERLSPEEAVARGRDPKQLDKHGLWPDVVLEIEPVRPEGGKIVWEWRAADHLIQDFDPSKSGYGSIPDNPGRLDINGEHRDTPPMTLAELKKQRENERKMRELGYAGGDDDSAEASDDEKPGRRPGGDFMHVNSVDYDAANDLILLSSPRFSEMWVIDHSTTTAEARTSSGGKRGKGGDVLYRWGNPRMYGAGTRDDQQLFGQHQPEWIPAGHPGAGHVLVFNNGDRRPGGAEFSQVDEIALPFDPARGFQRSSGSAFGPAAPAWSYTAPERGDFYSFFISGCQRLANGNTFICAGQQGRLFEVQPDGRIVWEYWNPHGGEIPASFGNANPNKGGPTPVKATSVFRATRIAANHAGLARLKAAGK